MPSFPFRIRFRIRILVVLILFILASTFSFGGLQLPDAAADSTSESCLRVELQPAIYSIHELPVAEGPIQLLFAVSYGSGTISGGIAATPEGTWRSDGEIRSRIDEVIDGGIQNKDQALGKPGIDAELTQMQISDLASQKTLSHPYAITGFEAHGVADAALGEDFELIPCSPTRSEAADETGDFYGTEQSTELCPTIFPTCPKSHDDRNWAADGANYWDFHWFLWEQETYGGNYVYVLFMDTTWSSASHLSLFTGDNDGFEVNTSLRYLVLEATYHDVWASDYPGAYLETVRRDDDVTTFAVGTDQAENLRAGEYYRNQIWIRSARYLNGYTVDYYQQVDLDMVSNGDIGFWSDEACGDEMSSCRRTMQEGQYQSWGP